MGLLLVGAGGDEPALQVKERGDGGVRRFEGMGHAQEISLSHALRPSTLGRAEQLSILLGLQFRRIL